MEEAKKVLYRYEMSYNFNKPVMELVLYTIEKKTPCGYWIKHSYYKSTKPKWISNNANNPFACTDEKSALKSFIKRKMYRNVCIDKEFNANMEVIKMAKNKLNRDDNKRKN